MIVATDDQMPRLTGSSTNLRSARMPRKAKRRTAVVVRRGSQSHQTPQVGFAQIAPWQQRRNARTTPTSIDPSMSASHFQSPLNRKKIAQANANVMARSAFHA